MSFKDLIFCVLKCWRKNEILQVYARVCVCVTLRLFEHTFWIKKLWIVVLEKTLESPLGSKEIKIVNPKGYQAWIFIGRTDAEAEAPILWPPDAMNWLIEKDLDAGKDWGQEKKRATGDETVGWHHWLNGQKFEQIQGDKVQGSLACCRSWDHKERDAT